MLVMVAVRINAQLQVRRVHETRRMCLATVAGARVPAVDSDADFVWRERNGIVFRAVAVMVLIVVDVTLAELWHRCFRHCSTLKMSPSRSAVPRHKSVMQWQYVIRAPSLHYHLLRTSPCPPLSLQCTISRLLLIWPPQVARVRPLQLPLPLRKPALEVILLDLEFDAADAEEGTEMRVVGRGVGAEDQDAGEEEDEEEGEGEEERCGGVDEGWGLEG